MNIPKPSLEQLEKQLSALLVSAKQNFTIVKSNSNNVEFNNRILEKTKGTNNTWDAHTIIPIGLCYGIHILTLKMKRGCINTMIGVVSTPSHIICHKNSTHGQQGSCYFYTATGGIYKNGAHTPNYYGAACNTNETEIRIKLNMNNKTVCFQIDNGDFLPEVELPDGNEFKFSFDFFQLNSSLEIIELC
jgi:hypothetical protein